jgi:starch synthase
LQAVDVATVLFLFSEEVAEPTRLVHEPTGARVVALPPPRLYRRLRRHMVDPYGRTAEQAFGSGGALRAVARELAPYLTTPVHAFARELRREGCSAVLIQEYEFPRFDVLALRRPAGLPVFAVFQGGDYQRWRLESRVRPHTIRRAAGLIVAAETEHARLRRIYSGLPPVTHIFNPVDLERWRPGRRPGTRAALGIGEDERVAVWHGRIDIRKKGLDVLLTAWPEVAAGARLVLIGTGPDVEELHRLARAHGDSVILVARTDDPDQLRDLIAAGDVYVFPSRHEGFALAPVEAAGCGLPVVAARAGGVEDAFPAGEASGAVLVEREDAPSLAAGLARLLGDPAAAAGLGERARQRAVDAFGLPSVGRELRSFLWPEPGSP